MTKDVRIALGAQVVGEVIDYLDWSDDGSFPNSCLKQHETKQNPQEAHFSFQPCRYMRFLWIGRDFNETD
jgi:hypothetical protein